MKRLLPLGLVCLLLSSCVQYSLIPAETVSVRGMTVTPSRAWNKSPSSPGEKVELWTVDGELLNDLMFIGPLNDGEPVFDAPAKSVAMPNYRTGMLPNELEDLVATSLKNLYGGSISVETSETRPLQLPSGIAFRFSVRFFLEDGLLNSGEVLALPHQEQLYLIVFTAADIHYYRKYADEIDRMMSQVRLPQ